ncbi:MAG: hypothetical protein V3R96_06795 [Dehalococcoidales bacterium]
MDCEIACGLDWSSPEILNLTRQRIKNSFDDEIQLAYFDLAEAGDSEDLLEWQGIIKDKKLSLPLLLLNGEIRISGKFDIRQLIDTIEVQKEIGIGE